MTRQALLTPDFARMVSKSMTLEKLSAALPMKELYDAQKVIITGCGDSWMAGIAAKPVFEALAKRDTEVWRCVEFSRYFSGKALGYSPNTPLVIAISFSGQVSRVVEALERAGKYGANTLLITSDPASPAAKAAKHVLPIEFPQGEYQPGLNSYVGAVTVLMMIALRMAHAKDHINGATYNHMVDAIGAYGEAYRPLLPEMSERARHIANEWEKLRCYDFVGDYADYATAFFGSAKVIECFGGYTTYDDSEDWCHINYFLRDPATIGRVFIANSDTPSYGRLLETLKAVKQLTSPCIVVSDSAASAFPSGFEVFTTPKPEYSWLSPLMQHLPFDYVAAYIAGLKNVEFFRNNDPLFEGIYSSADRIRNSKIEIV